MSQSSAPVGAETEAKEVVPQCSNLSQMELDNLRLVSDTLKRNPKIELSQGDLLKLLCYLEGELQARDVVIATLRSESLKRFITSTTKTSTTPALTLNDPHAALFRDHVAMSGNIASKESSTLAAKCELEFRNVADQRMQTLEELIVQQRSTQVKMVNILKNVESKQKQLVQDLDEERRKHEQDTAQGDDITYGLELERTRLKQELEVERESRKKLEKDLKKFQETLEADQARQKHIVLFLLVERKKIIMKYIEEKKRSEDLALILSEEKLKVDTLSEDLEEESKKSLRMEADMEKQTLTFDRECESLLARLGREEAKNHEKDIEIKQLREELDEIRKMNGRPNTGKFIATSQLKSNIEDLVAAPNPLVKVVQPTSIAISGPVAGPTTGIAKSVTGTGQILRSGPSAISIVSKTLNQVNQNPPQPPIKKSAILSTAATAPVIVGGTGNTTGTIIAARGNPPPIPPNKPVIPVKRDQNSRIPFATSTSTTAASNNVINAASASASSRTASCDYEDTAQPIFNSNNLTK